MSAATSPPAVCPRASPLVVPSRARRPPSNVCRHGRVLDARARYRRRYRVSSTDLGSTHAHARALLPTAAPRAGLSKAEANARSRALRHSPGKGTRGTRGAGRAGAPRRGARRLPLTDLVLLLLVDLLLEHARGAAHRAAPVRAEPRLTDLGVLGRRRLLGRRGAPRFEARLPIRVGRDYLLLLVLLVDLRLRAAKDGPRARRRTRAGVHRRRRAPAAPRTEGGGRTGRRTDPGRSSEGGRMSRGGRRRGRRKMVRDREGASARSRHDGS